MNVESLKEATDFYSMSYWIIHLLFFIFLAVTNNTLHENVCNFF